MARKKNNSLSLLWIIVLFIIAIVVLILLPKLSQRQTIQNRAEEAINLENAKIIRDLYGEIQRDEAKRIMLEESTEPSTEHQVYVLGLGPGSGTVRDQEGEINCRIENGIRKVSLTTCMKKVRDGGSIKIQAIADTGSRLAGFDCESSGEKDCSASLSCSVDTGYCTMKKVKTNVFVYVAFNSLVGAPCKLDFYYPPVGSPVQYYEPFNIVTACSHLECNVGTDSFEVSAWLNKDNQVNSKLFKQKNCSANDLFCKTRASVCASMKPSVGTHTYCGLTEGHYSNRILGPAKTSSCLTFTK